jgi:hypothetical protein
MTEKKAFRAWADARAHNNKLRVRAGLRPFGAIPKPPSPRNPVPKDRR